MQILLASAALDVAASNLDLGVVCGGQAEVAAERGKLVGAPQRIGAADGELLDEDAAGRDLRQRTVLEEVEFAVYLRVLVELEVQERAHGVALVRTLVVVHRAE